MTTFGSQNNCSNVRAHFVRTPVKPISLIPETNPYSIWWDGHITITLYVLGNFMLDSFGFILEVLWPYHPVVYNHCRNLSVAHSITIWNQIPKRIRIIVVLEKSRDQLIDRICHNHIFIFGVSDGEVSITIVWLRASYFLSSSISSVNVRHTLSVGKKVDVISIWST